MELQNDYSDKNYFYGTARNRRQQLEASLDKKAIALELKRLELENEDLKLHIKNYDYA